MVLMSPSDGHLRPVHALRFCWCDCIYFSLKPAVISLILVLHKDMILLDVGFLRVLASSMIRLALMILISLTFSRLHWQWPRQLLDTLL
jgi:hypothetical protein